MKRFSSKRRDDGPGGVAVGG
eukprot:SAG11_NODE_25058_length_364_cov_0.939623_1_plen_20_part_01